MLMSTREIILTAFRTLLRGPQFLHNILSMLFGDVAIVDANHSHQHHHSHHQLQNHNQNQNRIHLLPQTDRIKPSTYLRDIERCFGAAVEHDVLLQLSDALQEQFKTSLQHNMNCMLPSYNHQLPTGKEKGTFLALDMGGTTFRVALIELCGKDAGEPARILSLQSYKIRDETKRLRGHAFFDWMASKIEETIMDGMGDTKLQSTLPMGLAWSFPIEQTSLRGGLLQEMGKGFLAATDLLGEDLGCIIQSACLRRSLSVQVEAIVNDSAATLLSKAYEDPSTRMALILGTGVNAAVHLPVSSVGAVKFGIRPSAWHAAAQHVLVNTELSMFGGGLLPLTRWDEALNATHGNATFQPFEYLVSGRYLGEIVRLVLVEGIERTGTLFGGVVPASLLMPYALDTKTLSLLTAAREDALPIWTDRHPAARPPCAADLQFVRDVAALVTRRAAALVAVGVHALWALRSEAEVRREAECRKAAASKREIGGEAGARPESTVGERGAKGVPDRFVISYNGSVLEHYPGFREACQGYLDGLVGGPGLELRAAVESSLLGAAVAVACVNLDI